MNKTLETVEAVHTHTHTTHFLRDKNGVSLIALVITIIVVIILAAIAFNSSTTTIGKANYSKFVTNISEVQSAIRQKMITVKGTMMANGTDVIDKLCETLYSNAKQNLIARNITMEDLDKACDYTSPSKDAQLRYAWYSADTEDSDLKDVIAGGKVYKAQKHTASLAVGVDKPRFYDWDDENGITHYSLDENDYIELKSKDNPVLITRTFYGYNPSAFSAVVGDILNGDDTNRFWISSRYIDLYYEYVSVHYGIYTAYANNIRPYSPIYSSAEMVIVSCGLHPVVSLSSKSLDIADSSSDGKSSTSAWNIK